MKKKKHWVVINSLCCNNLNNDLKKIIHLCIFHTPTGDAWYRGEKCRLCSCPPPLQTSIRSTWSKGQMKRFIIYVQIIKPQ